MTNPVSSNRPKFIPYNIRRLYAALKCLSYFLYNVRHLVVDDSFSLGFSLLGRLFIR